jgi:hypothetical protein
MVPDFDPADERYHQWGKCGPLTLVTLDGVVQSYSVGVFEGPDGWVLFAGATMQDTHMCPSHPDTLCVEPRFGRVEVVHECPAVAAERRRQIEQTVADRARRLGPV